MRLHERRARAAAERFDVLEDEIPAGACQVRGCNSEPRYAWAGAFGTRWLCSRHRPEYRMHDRILAQIRAL